MIQAVKAYSDNYIWVYSVGEEALIVDPGEAEPILTFLQAEGLKPRAILLTHYHDDHIAGVPDVLKAYPGLEVYGPMETKAFNSQTLTDGDVVELLGLPIRVLKTNGHTDYHISYLIAKHLFCGDALFMAGCGRVFTGDYSAQFETIQKFKALDDEVLVYPGHEYSLTNLRFAMTLPNADARVAEVLKQVEAKRAKDLITLPSTIGLERQINPFFKAENLDEFKHYRDLRDKF